MLICFQATIGSRNAGGNRQEIRHTQIFNFRYATTNLRCKGSCEHTPAIVRIIDSLLLICAMALLKTCYAIGWRGRRSRICSATRRRERCRSKNMPSTRSQTRGSFSWLFMASHFSVPSPLRGLGVRTTRPDSATTPPLQYGRQAEGAKGTRIHLTRKTQRSRSWEIRSIPAIATFASVA